MIDKVWAICALASFIQAPQYLLRPLYGSNLIPHIVFSNLMDISMTLCMVQIEILMVTEWVSIMQVRGRVNTKSNALQLLQKIASGQLWVVSIGSTFLEQIMLPTLDNTKVPLALRGGSLFNFRGAYNTRWNALKNLNHGFVGVVFTVAGVVAANKISNQLQHSKNEKSKKIVSTLMKFMYAVCFAISLDLLYSGISSSIRLQQEYYFEYPSCGAFGEYIYAASLLKTFILLIVLYISKDSVLENKGKRNSDMSTSSFTLNTVTSLSNDQKVSDLSISAIGGEGGDIQGTELGRVTEEFGEVGEIGGGGSGSGSEGGGSDYDGVGGSSGSGNEGGGSKYAVGAT